MATARSLVLDDAVPLLTLTGPGGVGKTRLALAIGHEVATSFADGVLFVDLARVPDAADVLPAIADALSIPESGDRPVGDALHDALRPRQLLLILDNCEHVLAAAPELDPVLAACPAVQLLATSRAPLHLRGEYEMAVPPLALPPHDDMPVAELQQVEAVALFLLRARAVNHGFAPTAQELHVIGEICCRLDGLPLAIELAAARLKILSPHDLLGRLSARLEIVTGERRGLPYRHRTLRATIAWSYDLLSPQEQALFRRLAVFRGGCALEAAEAVATRVLTRDDEQRSPLDLVMRLVDQSLLRALPVPASPAIPGSTRIAMFETITEYALERLQAHGEEDDARREHAAIFLAFAERAAPELVADDPGWWMRMESERANLHQALAWLEQPGAGGEMLRLAVALERFWIPHGHLGEGRGWLERALALTQDHPLRGAALFAAANIADKQGDHGQSLAWITEGLAANRALGQPYGKLLLQLGGSARRHDLDEACALYEEAIVQLGVEADWQWLAWALGTLGVTLMFAGRDPARGADLAAEGLALHRSLGNEIGEGVLLAQLGTAAMAAGDARAAAGRYQESLRVLEGVGDAWHLVLPLSGAAELAGTIGAWAEAVQLLGAAEQILERTGLVSFPPEDGVPIARVRADALRALGELDFAQEHSLGRVLGAPEYLEAAKAVLDAVLEDGRGRRPPVAGHSRVPIAGADPRRDLTPREREILTLLCQRLTDPEIAELLFISPYTASKHVSNVLGKLGVANRREAAAFAARHGMV